MPQVQRTTSGLQTVSAASLQSLINTVKSIIISSGSVKAADVNQVLSAYNTWRQHTHSVSDLRGVDTFGNISVYGGGTYAASPTSSAARDTGGTLFPNEPFVNAINEQIDATDVNTTISRINSIRDHKHTIFDTTS